MARTHRSPDKGYASTGAVRQHAGSLPVYICNTCGREVVWVESKRTGKPYLVTVTRGYLDQRFYMGHNVHPRDCTADDRKVERYQAICRNIAAACRAISAAHQAGEVDKATLLDALDALGDLTDDADRLALAQAEVA